MAKLRKRYFVQLAKVFKDQDVANHLMSVKLDGMRAYWDGGISRGLPCSEVPYANTAKDGIRKTPPIATGLWSRGGKRIPAPKDWLDQLPCFPLDGELYAGVGMFQKVMSTCKGSGNDWSDIEYCIYGRPSVYQQFCAGIICFSASQKIEVEQECLDFVVKRCTELGYDIQEFSGKQLIDVDVHGDNHRTIPQLQLPSEPKAYLKMIADKLEFVTSKGGEGLMLADPNARWEPHRSHFLLKVKNFNESEGVVIGYTWGRKTDKGSKLANRMGQLKVRLSNGKEFGLSGFTEDERILYKYDSEGDRTRTDMYDWKDGEPCCEGIHSLDFPVGDVVRFKYRELSDDGIPKEGRFWR